VRPGIPRIFTKFTIDPQADHRFDQQTRRHPDRVNGTFLTPTAKGVPPRTEGPGGSFPGLSVHPNPAEQPNSPR
jgi:hypothetical protein